MDVANNIVPYDFVEPVVRTKSFDHTSHKKTRKKAGLFVAGAPEWIRTTDPRLRRPVLYPTELRARRERVV